jgi:hypothetical protein
MPKAKTARPARDQHAMPGRASQAGAAVAERGTDAASARRHPAQEGSCQTCVHRPRCLFFKAARRPIVFCEFDGAARLAD